MFRFLMFLLAVIPLGAQWLHLPTPGIPRTADGKPDLKAPPPRTPDGKPDLSGLWRKVGFRYDDDIAADLEPGIVKPWAEALYQQRKKDFAKDSLLSRCLPTGPNSMINPYHELRIMQSPGLIAILSDDLAHREIFMDGRQLEKDPNPSWMGYSVGHWDGERLVVESNGYNDKTWLDSSGHPHSEALRVTESYRRTDFGHVEVLVTFDDSIVFTKPVSVTIHMQLIADTEMLEFVCENERDQAHMPSGVSPLNVHVPVEILKTYVGTYDIDLGGRKIPAEILAENEDLFINNNQEGKEKLDALSETTFSLIGTIYEFIRDGQNGVKELRMKSAEAEYIGTRRK
jgi:hypothetical protein